MANQPHDVYVTSEYWPTAALDSLAATADPEQAYYRRTIQLEKVRPSFPMPAGELYAAIILPTMLSRAARIRTRFAVEDCNPAMRTPRPSHSDHAQMRRWSSPPTRRSPGYLHRDPEKPTRTQTDQATPSS